MLLDPKTLVLAISLLTSSVAALPSLTSPNNSSLSVNQTVAATENFEQLVDSAQDWIRRTASKKIRMWHVRATPQGGPSVEPRAFGVLEVTVQHLFTRQLIETNNRQGSSWSEVQVEKPTPPGFEQFKTFEWGICKKTASEAFALLKDARHQEMWKEFQLGQLASTPEGIPDEPLYAFYGPTQTWVVGCISGLITRAPGQTNVNLELESPSTS